VELTDVALLREQLMLVWNARRGGHGCELRFAQEVVPGAE